jgi:hypothetical protein
MFFLPFRRLHRQCPPDYHARRLCRFFHRGSRSKIPVASFYTEEERRRWPENDPDWLPPVPMPGNPIRTTSWMPCAAAIWPAVSVTAFAGRAGRIRCLPDGRMRLIHRILDLDPNGGRYGLGLIRAEADIHPDDWFLDLSFRGRHGHARHPHVRMLRPHPAGFSAAHGLGDGQARRVLRTGDRQRCPLKCRGPVTPATRHVHYEIQISESDTIPNPMPLPTPTCLPTAIPSSFSRICP